MIIRKKEGGGIEKYSGRKKRKRGTRNEINDNSKGGEIVFEMIATPHQAA